MNKEELKIWFWNLYNSCYVVKYDKYPNIDFLYYDENFVRTIKISQILERDIIYSSVVVGKCLFEVEYESKCLRIDYNKIWYVLESKLSYNYQEVKSLINVWLKEHDKLNKLTPILYTHRLQILLMVHDNFKILV